MWFTYDVFVLFASLVGFLSFSNAIKYRAIPEDDEVYSECSNQSKNVLNYHGLFDISKMNFTVEFDKIVMSGNSTLVWDIMPTDRVELSGEVFKFNRGVWEPTVIDLKVSDFCSIMFDKNQYWYRGYIAHITNMNEVKDNCVNVPGTTYTFEPFHLSAPYDFMSNMDGRSKLVINLKAFDSRNRVRPTSICFEVKFESIRI